MEGREKFRGASIEGSASRETDYLSAAINYQLKILFRSAVIKLDSYWFFLISINGLRCGSARIT